MKNSFILYADIISTISLLSNEEAGKLFKLILDYQNGIDLQNNSIDFSIKLVLFPIIEQFKRDKNKWESIKNERKEAGRLGGLAKQANAKFAKQNLAKPSKSSKTKQSLANLAVSVSVSDSVNDSVNDSVSDSVSDSDYKNIDIINCQEKEKEKNKKEKEFLIPSIEEISSYCNERNNGINPQKFFNFYESKGWMIGKNKMKDWKASIRTWEEQPIEKKKSLWQIELEQHERSIIDAQIIS